MDDEKMIKEYVKENDIQPRPIKNFFGIYNGDELVRLQKRSNEIRKLVQGYNRDIGIAAGTVDCLEIKEKNQSITQIVTVGKFLVKQRKQKPYRNK